jgi:hypothetical protein
MCVTDLTDPTRVKTHVVVDGKWTITASQPYHLGYGVPDLSVQQAERISRRIAITLYRQQNNLPEWM